TEDRPLVPLWTPHVTFPANAGSSRRMFHPLTQYPQEFATNKTPITSPELTPPVGPFSQAIQVDGFLYFSGQVAQDPATGGWSRGALCPRRSASSSISQRFSRRPARVSMMSSGPVCFSRA